MIKVDKKIPAPKRIASSLERFPFSKMEIGDSFQVPQDEKIEVVRSYASLAGRNSGRKYCVRKFNGGHRCWRVS